MKALDFVATNINRRDEQPNLQLANEIIKTKNHKWIKELIENLANKNKNIQSDCIKTLYEIGENGYPELIAPYWENFINIFNGNNNRLIWGAMIALDTITILKPDEIYSKLDIILKIMEEGTTITIDHGVSLLAQLSSFRIYRDDVLPKLINQLEKCPIKQFPMYIEKSVKAIDTETKEVFIRVINQRYDEMKLGTQRKRIDKSMKFIKAIR